MECEALLSLKGISKTFPGVVALDSVNFEVEPGEVHALMGENGAGKSTLIKVLTGLYEKDAGEIVFDGENVKFDNTKQSQDSGISTIYQELNLIPELSVAENLFMGRHPQNVLRIDWKKMYNDAKDQLQSLGVNVDVRKKLSSCGTAIQQMVAIARAVSMEAKLVIMDEPTSSLGEKEVLVLFDLIRRIKERGIATIFITHRLDEIFEICDRVTVLRDGKLIGTKRISAIDKYELVTMMIGRNATDVINRHKIYDSNILERKVLFEAKNMTMGVKLNGIDLTIREGEIVGLAGLLGSGRTEFARAIFGVAKKDTGEIYFDGKKKIFSVPRHAIRAGIGFMSEDRKVEGIVPSLSVRENLTLAMLPKIAKWMIVHKKTEISIVDRYIERLQIKTHNREAQILNLSGGNQQKVILARWLSIDPKLLILDEPTRGIDVGAKAEIEQLIQELAQRGIGILLISSQIEELIRNCDRLAIIQNGQKISELIGEEINQNNIMRALAIGHSQGETV